ncbi:MAG: hypothetical protein KME64_34625 [Scytonematopsis contorta HA4267-MV1]|nr:hypothetical protein [Scytonematopsis contorta HA4267-MV1]
MKINFVNKLSIKFWNKISTVTSYQSTVNSQQSTFFLIVSTARRFSEENVSKFKGTLI